jgi:hypothetical protein
MTWSGKDIKGLMGISILGPSQAAAQASLKIAHNETNRRIWSFM